MRAAALALSIAAAGAVPYPDPKFPPLQKYTIDLDLPPEQRWNEVVRDHTKTINTVVGLLKPLFNGTAKDKNITKTLIAALKRGLPDEYARELRGIAAAVPLDYDDALMATLFYEISTLTGELMVDGASLARACTSIVAQNSNGTVYLGRNMDYPPPMAPLQVDATFVRGGRTVYEGTVFAGTIGPITGVVPGGFAVSCDARDFFEPTLDAAARAAAAGGYPFTVFVRAAMDAAADYATAVAFFRDTPMISPGYVIVAGTQRGEGAVVTTNTSAAGNDVWRMADGKSQDGGPSADWYLVETNFDHWKPQGPLKRRQVAKEQVAQIGQDAISLSGLWQVLSTSPVYNPVTVNTVLIEPATGDYRTYMRHHW